MSMGTIELLYNTEREIYRKMVTTLGRHPVESMQVMGFWLWLDGEVCVQTSFLKDTLLKLPEPLFNEALEESIMCLKCVEEDKSYMISSNNSLFQLCFLPNLIGRKITLKNFHDNRVAVIYGTMKMINKVCVKALKDIFEQNACIPDNLKTFSLNFPDLPGYMKNKGHCFMMEGFNDSIYSLAIDPDFGSWKRVAPGSVSLDAPPIFPDGNNQRLRLWDVPSFVGGGGSGQWTPSITSSGESSQSKEEPMTEEVMDGESPEHRTVFFTFPNGYSPSEDPFRDFLSRKFGDCVEDFEMKKVMTSHQQPLFARLVARTASNCGSDCWRG